jgi:hypothetical protein
MVRSRGRRVSDLSDRANVLEAMGDLLNCDEGEDA